MPQSTISFNVFVALEVFGHLPAQITFHEDHAIIRAGLFRTHLGGLNGLSDGGQFVLAQVWARVAGSILAFSNTLAEVAGPMP